MTSESQHTEKHIYTCIHIHTQHFTALEDTSMQHVTLHTIQPDRAAGVWCINSPQ